MISVFKVTRETLANGNIRVITPKQTELIIHISNSTRNTISVRRDEEKTSPDRRYRNLGYVLLGDAKVFDGLRIVNHIDKP